MQLTLRYCWLCLQFVSTSRVTWAAVCRSVAPPSPAVPAGWPHAGVVRRSPAASVHRSTRSRRCARVATRRRRAVATEASGVAGSACARAGTTARAARCSTHVTGEASARMVPPVAPSRRRNTAACAPRDTSAPGANTPTPAPSCRARTLGRANARRRTSSSVGAALVTTASCAASSTPVRRLRARTTACAATRARRPSRAPVGPGTSAGAATCTCRARRSRVCTAASVTASTAASSATVPPPGSASCANTSTSVGCTTRVTSAPRRAATSPTPVTCVSVVQVS